MLRKFRLGITICFIDCTDNMSDTKKNKIREKIACKFCAKKIRSDNLAVHIDAVHMKVKKPCYLCGKMLHPTAISRHQKNASACKPNQAGK